MTLGEVTFVCPACRGSLARSDRAYACARCVREYPIVCGIADFRLDPDPYISIEADRQKGERLFAESRGRSFESLLRHYYAVTPEDPPDLAERWTARALAEVDIASALLRQVGITSRRADFDGTSGALLDVGCSTGALLIAAHGARAPLVGVDVAFRWLVIGQARLREAGVVALLVCANAERLPFEAGSFGVITAADTLEHVRDAAAAVAEAARVAAPGASLVATANNRFAPLPEPNVHLWGVGYLPRAWQARYVAARRADLHPYRITLRSVRELHRLCRNSGWREVRLTPALLMAPHASRAVNTAIAIYNRVASFPVSGSILKPVAPRLLVRARR